METIKMMWSHNENCLRPPLPLCLYLPKCLTRTSFTPLPPPADATTDGSKEEETQCMDKCPSPFLNPKDRECIGFFFFYRVHTSCIGFPHLYVCLNDFNIKPKVYSWFGVQTNLLYSLEHSCVVSRVKVLSLIKRKQIHSTIQEGQRTQLVAELLDSVPQKRDRGSSWTFTRTHKVRGQGIQIT